MPSARLDSHRNSVQNGVVESFPAITGTIFVNFLTFAIFRTILTTLRCRNHCNLHGFSSRYDVSRRRNAPKVQNV